MSTVGAHPARVDVEAYANAPTDFSVSVLDALGLPATSLAGWSVAATAAPAGGAPVALTAVIEGGEVRISATPAQNAAWYDTWPEHAAPWDVVLTDPGGVPQDPFAAGWWRLYPTRTRPTP